MHARFFPLLLLLCIGCGRTSMYEYDGEPNCYAQASYVQRLKAKTDALRPEFDTPTEELVDLSSCDPWGWERKPYETIDQWHDRIHLDLCCARDELEAAQEEVKDVIAYEAMLAKQTQGLVAQNEQLRQRHSELVQQNVSSVTFQKVSQPPPNFHIHLVRKGETLYSIAMDHYGDADMVQRMLSWNQGWLRGPDSLVAGVGLVLFPATYKGSAQEEVTAYIRGIDPSRTSTHSR